MPVEELINVRQKYKGAYDDLSDSDLAGMLATKYPAYKDLPDRVNREARPVGQDFSGLAGGAQAKIQAPPGYLSTMASAFTEPFNQPRQEIGAEEPRPGPLAKIGRTALGTLQVINSPFDALGRGITKFAEQNLPVSPRQAEDIGGATGAIAGNVLPFLPAALRGRAPQLGARTVEDLIARQRSALPPAPEMKGKSVV